MYSIYSHNFNNKLEAQKITWVVCGCLEPYSSGSEEVWHSHLPYALMNIPKTKKPFAKVFSIKFGAVASFGSAKVSNPQKFSLQKSYFSPIHESFLPRKFPAIRYGVSVFSKIVLCFRAEHGYKYEWQLFSFMCCGGLRVLWWLETCFHSSQIPVLNTKLGQFMKINCKPCDIHFRLELFRL